MSVRMRHTKGHTRNRRSHHSLESERFSRDTSTGVTHLRHRVCLKTGKYKGKEVIDMTPHLLKKQDKLKKKEEQRKMMKGDGEENANKKGAAEESQEKLDARELSQK